MHPYLPFLLEDITNALRQEHPHSDTVTETIEERDLEAVEGWVCGDIPDHTLGYYCGLDKEQFPPATQLSTEDMQMVYDAFERMLYSWNAELSLPDELPWSLRYQFMVRTLEEGMPLIAGGDLIMFDFCSGYAPGCPFGEYCCCRDYWGKEKEEDEMEEL